ncbi:TRAP transporter small permease [Cognatiyoonia sp. IB215182]|uniref:TRAP transporter small permease n=1 Tax=Cognatiyoonia sp. IB215182 TaxID=3097353 RepID=UPI002A16261E|nr:TRAP transporter small permease [Cognatiyoonia sp. IB215182]MDX8352958.1 TRAP transporter small permease [Cognatiyoonia sp. IB215182]
MAKTLQRAGQWLALLCVSLSGICLIALMLLTVAEVIGRYGFNAPIFGRQDIAQILLACSIFLAFPVVTLRGQQIDVDLMDGFFSSGVAFWRDRLIQLLTAGTLLTMGYWLYLRGVRIERQGLTSDLLFLPKYPLVYGIAGVVFTTGIALAIYAVVIAIKGRRP